MLAMHWQHVECHACDCMQRLTFLSCWDIKVRQRLLHLPQLCSCGDCLRAADDVAPLGARQLSCQYMCPRNVPHITDPALPPQAPLSAVSGTMDSVLVVLACGLHVL